LTTGRGFCSFSKREGWVLVPCFCCLGPVFGSPPFILSVNPYFINFASSAFGSVRIGFIFLIGFIFVLKVVRGSNLIVWLISLFGAFSWFG